MRKPGRGDDHTKMRDDPQNITIAVLPAACTDRFTKASFKHRVYLIFRIDEQVASELHAYEHMSEVQTLSPNCPSCQLQSRRQFEKIRLPRPSPVGNFLYMAFANLT